MRFFRNYYLTLRFFLIFGIIIFIMLFSFSYAFLFNVAVGLIGAAMAITFIDTILVFNPGIKITCERITPKVFSNGSINHVRIELHNKGNMSVNLSMIDELPAQLAKRDFLVKLKLKAKEKKQVTYEVAPTVRGEYKFGRINLYIKSFLKIVERRKTFNLDKTVAVYPSIIEMKKHELRAFAKISHFQGIKKIRRLGHSYEFEQIKNYVKGDDFRSINWKATGRRGSLMVNQYEDEKAQQIYCLIDKSRSMSMPFNGLSLLDYAINTSLVITNIALLKQDKAGLVTFAEKIHTALKAERGKVQLKKILEALYKEQERSLEANYEYLYLSIKNLIKGRSLIFLYTNFESYYALERVMPVLRKISNTHLLVLVFFENTEIIDYQKKSVENMEEIYFQTIAQKFVFEKNKIVHELKQYGIQSILTRPENLSIDTINKYLELKSRGMI